MHIGGKITLMELFIIYGMIGTIELAVLFGIIHYLMSRKNPRQRWWLVPLSAVVFGYGYAFNIFIIEKEGENSFSGFVANDIMLYLFVFSFFSTLFCGLFVAIKVLLDKRQPSPRSLR
jgi:hypothetical protein